jgi:AraC-like DNA-binding protein
VIVADVMMPGLDGLEMTRRLRQDEDAVTAGIPLLFLTARAGTDDEREGLRSGGDDYLRKPFEAAVLRARVKALIARQHRLRERLRAESHAPENGERDAASPFEETVRGLIREHLPDPDFDVAALAEEAALSRRQLTRRLKEATEDGITPARLIRRMRLERGARLLESGEQNITQVAYAVGFKSLSHFSRRFKERFGPPPSQYEGRRAGPAS